jgi:hypothetical protein
MKPGVILIVIAGIALLAGGAASAESLWQCQVEGGATGAVLGLWGSAWNDVFAVGEDGLILHYDGTAWQSMDSGTELTIKGVWGLSGSDVFAVGDEGLILHYDGHSWSPVASPWTEGSLLGIWGLSADDLYAVGESGTILHFNGSSWTAYSSGTATDATGRSTDFVCVWGSSAEDVWVGSFDGTMPHYDGTEWSYPRSTTKPIFALSGTGPEDIFAVGGYASFRTIILHYDGAKWKGMSGAGTRALYDVWAIAVDDAFLVGDGVLMHYDGEAWASMEHAPVTYMTVWADGTGAHAYVGGADGSIYYLDRSE